MTILLQLLVDDLDEWPEDADYIAQDINHVAYTYIGMEPWFDTERDSWVCPMTRGGDLGAPEYWVFLDDLAYDYASTIITRAQWEAAKNERMATD